MLPQHKALLRAVVPFLFFLLLLIGCGTAPQATTQEQNLQGTVSALQTQVANQPGPSVVQAAITPAQVPTNVPPEPTAIQAATTPAQQPTSLSSTNIAGNSSPQEYVAVRDRECGDEVDFLSWTEKDGQFKGTITAGSHSTVNGVTAFHIIQVPVKGTRQDSSIALAIFAHDEWEKYTAVFKDNENTLDFLINGQVCKVYHRGSKQDFDREVAKLTPSATPIIEPTVNPPD